jgi:pyruvate dehydrogenase E1 component alpha subunit
VTSPLRPLPRPESRPDPVCLIDEHGEVTDLGRQHGVSVELARRLYADMAQARRFDHEAYALQRQGELALWLMCLGQEAAQVGSIRALRPDDHVFPSYRDHAAALCRGIGPEELLVQWRGNTHSGWDPQPYRFHIYSLVLASQTLHATGYAMGIQLDRTDEIVLTYVGDGATSQGDFNEALNWAQVSRAPIIFFCQNNHWAISTPSTAQTGADLYQRAHGFGLATFLVDGNDALAVHAVTTAAAESVREGGGPAFIEARTYRMAGHSTSDDPSRYRSEAEVALWRERDPLLRLESFLRKEGTPDSYFAEVDRTASELAARTRAAVESFVDPDPATMFDHVFTPDMQGHTTHAFDL